jgi:hypothetical protein
MMRFLLFVSMIVVSVSPVVRCARPEAERSITDSATVSWEVRITEPASGLVEVRGRIPGEAIDGSSLILRFLDLRRFPEGLHSLEARSVGQALTVETGGPSEEHVRRVATDGTSEVVEIEYTIDPTYYPPGSRVENVADARSRVGGELAVLRSTSLFPALNIDPHPAHVTFVLPEDWVAVAPWRKASDGLAVDPEDGTSVEYIGVGPLEVRELRIEDTTFRVATVSEQAVLNLESVAAAIQYHVDLLGAPPTRCSGGRAVIIVTSRFMRGGAAGRCSIVQSPSPEVLSHEVFHWWTHAALVRPEARWFSEGFTNYYGIKAARESGLMSEEQAALCLADLWGEMLFLEAERRQSLSAASVDYDSDGRARRLVYSKGTLFALDLDRNLQERSRSLDEAMGAILSEARRSLTNVDLLELFNRVYGNGVDAEFDAYVENNEALPALGLGPATGRSGCARYLPDN